MARAYGRERTLKMEDPQPEVEEDRVEGRNQLGVGPAERWTGGSVATPTPLCHFSIALI